MRRLTRRNAGLAILAAPALTAQELNNSLPNSRLFTFAGGDAGTWTVTSMNAVIGEPLPAAKRLQVVSEPAATAISGATWTLRGVTSNSRYATRSEVEQLTAKQEPIGRAGATRAALIPIRKNAAWWGLPQDERRRIFEERSHHTRTGLKYLPAIARRLHHCRDLGAGEPFDFLTWFDYAPESSSAFEDLVAELRATEEWKFVDREIDIRLAR